MEPVVVVTHYDIQESASGLRVRASQDTELWVRLIAAGGAATVVGMVTASYLGLWLWAGFLIVAGITAFLTSARTGAQLHATKFEFTSTGNIGRRVRRRVVYTADVRRLEFWQAGGPFRSGPDGLYTVTDHGRKCLLPFLDYRQTIQVIRAIEDKFPGLAQKWRAESPHSLFRLERPK